MRLREAVREHIRSVGYVLAAFDRVSFRERVRRVIAGWNAPAGSRERCLAEEQLRHLPSLAGAVVVPAMVLLVLLQIASRPPPYEPSPTSILPSRPDAELDRKPVEPDPAPASFAETAAAVPDFAPVFSPPEFSGPTAENTGPLLPAMSTTKLPMGVRTVPLPGLMGPRTGAERARALEVYHAPAGSEDAVLRALRWLRAKQEPDGSWLSPKPAMTGLALLCFLARGEDATSGEFGDATRRAVEWLVSHQTSDGRFEESDPNEYSLPIAAYALSEAVALTRLPMAAEAAGRSLGVIVAGQHPSGGWDYKCRQSLRDDTSYMGWCAQALKAGKLARLDVPGMDEALARAVNGFARNSDPSGGFGYTEPGAGGLTGVGVLCMQMLGAPRAPEALRGLAWLRPEQFKWDAMRGPRPLYYAYYTTQAKFHAGGRDWDTWNGGISWELIRSQQRVTAGAEERGFWNSPSETENYGTVYSTAMCTLILEVYYRYLPTYRRVVEPGGGTGESVVSGTESGIEVMLPDGV